MGQPQIKVAKELLLNEAVHMTSKQVFIPRASCHLCPDILFAYFLKLLEQIKVKIFL